MLIGGNNFNNNKLNTNTQFEQNRFQKSNAQVEQNQQILSSKANFKDNTFTEDLSTFKHTNATNNNDMYDKSLAMLHERLDNNLITLEEFNKKCEQLGKKRQQF